MIKKHKERNEGASIRENTTLGGTRQALAFRIPQLHAPLGLELCFALAANWFCPHYQ